MEHRWTLEGIQCGKESWLEQYDGIWRWRISLPTRPTARTGIQSSSKALSVIWSQQKKEAHLDLGELEKQLEKTQRERDQANLDRDKATIDRDQAVLEKDKVILEMDLLRAERDQAQNEQESTTNCDQIKSELERLQRKQ